MKFAVVLKNNEFCDIMWIVVWILRLKLYRRECNEMAKLRPIELPEEIINDPFRQSEVRFFDACKRLPDTWIVLYSVTWYDGQSEGEADFVIVSPDTGVIVVEVKGGGIGRDENGWYSIDRNEEKHTINDPVKQASNSKGSLLKYLRKDPCFDGRYIPIRHMMCFPNVPSRNAIDLMDIPRKALILHEDLINLKDSILNFAIRNYDDIHRPLSMEDCQKIVDILIPNFEMLYSASLEDTIKDNNNYTQNEGIPEPKPIPTAAVLPEHKYVSDVIKGADCIQCKKEKIKYKLTKEDIVALCKPFTSLILCVTIAYLCSLNLEDLAPFAMIAIAAGVGCLFWLLRIIFEILGDYLWWKNL